MLQIHSKGDPRSGHPRVHRSILLAPALDAAACQPPKILPTSDSIIPRAISAGGRRHPSEICCCFDALPAPCAAANVIRKKKESVCSMEISITGVSRAFCNIFTRRVPWPAARSRSSSRMFLGERSCRGPLVNRHEMHARFVVVLYRLQSDQIKGHFLNPFCVATAYSNFHRVAVFFRWSFATRGSLAPYNLF